MKKTLSIMTAAVLSLSAQHALAQANVAVLHLAPFADTAEGTQVDVFVNGGEAISDFQFGEFTGYIELDAGETLVEIVPEGASEPALSGSFMLMDGVSYSVAAIGDGANQPLELFALVDDNPSPMDGNVAVRVAHTAPFAASLAATEVSVRTDGGTVVNGLQGVPYKVDSGFFMLPGDTEYNLKIASNDGSVNLIDVKPATLPAGANVTLWAIGDGVNQDLGVLAWPVGILENEPTVDHAFNGWWEFVPGSAVGAITQPIPAQDRMVGTVYLFDAEGNRTWYTFDTCAEDVGSDGTFECSTPGSFDGEVAEAVLLESTGGGIGEGFDAMTVPVGTLNLWFPGPCSEVIAEVTFDGSDPLVLDGNRLTSPFCED